jgi:hypothetical protein
VLPRIRRRRGRRAVRRMIARMSRRAALPFACFGIAVCASLLLSACGGASKQRRTVRVSDGGRVSNGGLPGPTARGRREVEEDRREEARIALLGQPSPELNAGGARLVQEVYGAQLSEWSAFYERRFGGLVHEVWQSTKTSRGSRVTLEYTAESSVGLSGRAQWSVQPLNAAEQDQGVNPAQLIHPKNALARQFQVFPTPQAGAKSPVLLYAAEILTPVHRVAAVKLSLREGYQPLMFSAGDGFGEGVLRGYDLAHEVSLSEPPRYLPLASDAAIYKATIEHGRITAVTPVRFKALRESFSRGIVPLLIGWRHGAAKLSTLLARPVQTLIILEP